MAFYQLTVYIFKLTLLLELGTTKTGINALHQFEKEDPLLIKRPDLKLKFTQGSHTMSNVFVHLSMLCKRQEFNYRDQS